jgi:YfaZ precursor
MPALLLCLFRRILMRAPAGLGLLAAIALPSLSFAADNELQLDLNGDALRLSLAREIPARGLLLEGGVLHHQDNGDVLHLGLLVNGDAGARDASTEAGLGVRLAALDGDGQDREGWAVAIGGQLRYALPQFDRFTLGLSGWYAPDILSGGDAEAYTDVTGRLGYAITRQAEVYVGARYVRGEYEKGPDAYFDTGLHIGIGLRF